MENKIAVIGAGNWGKNHVRNFYQMGMLGGIYDESQAVLDSLKSLYPNVKLSTNYEEAIKDNNIKGVVIATPAETHFTVASKAIENGKSVLIEKPMTTTVEDAEKIVELAEKNPDVTVMVGHLMLYHPALKRIKLMIEEGVLGDINYLYSRRVNLGQVRSVENVIWSLGVHDVSVFVSLIKSNVEYVDAQGCAYLQDGIEDLAFINLYFKNGAMAHIHVSWLDPLKIRTMTFVGNKRMAVFDDIASNEKLRIYDKGVNIKHKMEKAIELRNGDIRIPFIDNSEPLRNECLHFIECMDTGAKPVSDAYQGLEVIKIMTAADEAVEQCSKIRIQNEKMNAASGRRSESSNRECKRGE